MSNKSFEATLFNLDAEKGLLSSILINDNQLKECMDILPYYFHDERHQHLWKAFLDIHTSGAVIDPVTLDDMLQRNGIIDIDNDYILSLMTFIESSIAAVSYKKIVKDFFNRRELFTEANIKVQKALNLNIPLDNINEDIIDNNYSRFKLGKASDAFEPRPPIEWIIKDVIKENSLNSWFGKYGHKKTFCALSAAVCVASGIPWIGQSTLQSPVLFVDEESGRRTLLDRMEAAVKGESQDKNIPLYYLSLSAFNFLKNEKDIDFLQKYIIETHSKLIFIDAFDDVMSGGDENSVKDNQPVLIQLRRVCEETNSAIILLHHTNKRGDIRGSTSIPGSLNTALKITSENNSSRISFTTDKMRDSKTFTKDAEIFYVDKNNDFSELESFYIIEDTTPFEDKINDTQKEILDYMKSNNNELIVKSFLDSVTKEKQSSYKKAIYNLRDHNIIKKDVEKSLYHQAIYSIS